MIEFRMLGEIRLKTPDGTEVDAILRQPKRLAVLAYLASPAPGTRHRRDLLLALFWPELDTPHARTSLRNALYVLRQSLGDEVLLSAGDEEVSVNPTMLRTDLALVYAALREGRIDDALGAYGGELLPGLYPADSEGFHRWLDSERARLKVAVSSAAVGTLNELENKKEFPQALAIARRLLEIQPDDETIVRRAMSLHESVGDMAGSLNVFEKYRARLAADFDAAPSPETSALAERLRSAPRPPTRNKATAVPEPRPATNAVVAPDTISLAVPALQQTPDRPRRWPIALAVAVGVAGVATIGLVSARPSQPDSLGTSHPFTTEEGIQVEAAISPNGRLVAYAKGNTAHVRIYVQKIGGGPAWPLTDDSLAQEVVPRWSPDNDQVLFLAHDNAYVSPSIGGTPRIVARGTGGNGSVRSAAWSPDGDSMVIVRNDSLMVQSIDDTHTRYIGTGYQLNSCVWSPGEKSAAAWYRKKGAGWIACTSGNWIEFAPGPLFGNLAPSSILLFPAAGGDSIALTTAEFQNRSPAWSADGKFLWFLSARDGTNGQVYAIPIGKDGHAAGPITQVAARAAEWISLSSNRLAYSVPSRHSNVWAVPIPNGSPVSLRNAEQITKGIQLIETLTMSPDGRWLVYDNDINGNADIYRQAPVAGGKIERLTNDPRPEYSASLSPDNSELVWQRWNRGERRIVVRTVDGDSAVDIIPLPGDRGGPRWSRDGRAIAGWSHGTEEGTIFVVKRDSTGKWEKPSWVLSDAQLPVWSPDGKTIAFPRYDGSIQSIPADSGARTRLYAPRPGTDDPIADNIAWTTSPDTLWFIGHNNSGGSIWSLALSSGVKRQLVRLNDAKRSAGPTLATDQHRFFFTLDERFSNIGWAQLLKR
jgi:DNA-binding SARP family transcriptional activator/Tol biopolymer transport system component